jgi:hypothetical protein
LFAPGAAPRPKRNKKKKVVPAGVQGSGLPPNVPQQQQVDFGTGASLVQGQQLYGSAAVVGLQHQEQGFGSSSIPVQQHVIPQQAPAPLVPFQSQPALSSDTSLPSSTVVPIVEKTQPPGKDEEILVLEMR